MAGRSKQSASKAKRPVGRPRHVPTPETRQMVTELMAVGVIEGDIALRLRLDQKTLAKHYDQELRFGRVERRAEVVGLLFSAARKGNVTAQKHLEGMTAVAGAENALKGADLPAQPRAARLGKKEQAAIEAQAAGAGTDWAGDLGPAPETAH
jgi:hypothetical protein